MPPVKTANPTLVRRQGAPSLFLTANRAARFVDISGNRYVPANNGTITPGLLPTGPSLALNGSSGFVTVTGGRDPSLGTDDFTVALTVLPTSLAVEVALFDTLNVGGNFTRPNAFVLVATQTTGKLRIFTNSAYTSSSTNALTLNAANRVVIVRKGGTVSFWINGALDPTTVSMTTNCSSTALVIGRFADSAGGFVAGQMDNVQMFPRFAFSPADVARDNADPNWRTRGGDDEDEFGAISGPWPRFVDYADSGGFSQEWAA